VTKAWSWIVLGMLAAVPLAGCLAPADDGVDPASLLPPLALPALRCEVACNPLVSGGRANTNEPSIAIDPTNPSNMVAGANDYSQPLGGSWCGVYTSADGGRTWQADLLPGYPGDTRPGAGLWGFDFCGDAVLAFDANGDVYYSGIAFHRIPRVPVAGVHPCALAPVPCPDPYNVQIFVLKSTDKGKTWSELSIVSAGVSTVVFNDKNWLHYDPVSNNLYVVWTIYSFLPTTVMAPGLAPDPLSKGVIYFSRSGDGGRTWSEPKEISEGKSNQGAVPATDAKGTLYIVWNADDPDERPDVEKQPGSLAFVVSTDRGETFTKPSRFGPYHPMPSPLPNAFFRTSTLPGLAIDTTDGPFAGSLYVVYNDWNPAEEHADVKITVSRDGGATWSEPSRVNDDDTRTDQWMPNVAVDSAGRVHVVWLDRRDDPANTKYRAYAGISTDGGATFGQAPASDEASDPLADQDTDPLTGQPRRINFLGDYIQVATAGTRSFTPFPDLRAAGDGSRLVNVLLAEVGLPQER